MQVSKTGSRSTNLQGALGVWGRNGADVQERPGKSPVRGATLHSQGPGAIEACSSPGRSSTATESDTGVPSHTSKRCPAHGSAMMRTTMLSPARLSPGTHSLCPAEQLKRPSCCAGNGRSMFNHSVDIVPGKTDRRESAMVESLQSKHLALENENSQLRSELEKMHSVQGTSLSLIPGHWIKRIQRCSAPNSVNYFTATVNEGLLCCRCQEHRTRASEGGIARVRQRTAGSEGYR